MISSKMFWLCLCICLSHVEGFRADIKAVKLALKSENLDEQEAEKQGEQEDTAGEASAGVAQLTKSGSRRSQPVAAINAMQWSAHWKCFRADFFGATCGPKVETLLADFVKDYNLDFVNLGMFQSLDPAWTPPENYLSVDWKCSRDTIKFLYDKSKWEVAAGQTLTSGETTEPDKVQEPVAADVFGCGNLNTRGAPDRVYGVMAFQEIEFTENKVIVVVGHFPHPPAGTSSAGTSVAALTAPLLAEHMGAKIAHIKAKTGWEDAKVLLIADLNNDFPGHRDPAFDNAEKINEAFAVMDPTTVKGVEKMTKSIRVGGAVPDQTVKDALKAPNQGWVTQPIMSQDEAWNALNTGALGSSTPDIKTCCADKPAMVDGNVAFPYAFDRILASFGPLQVHMPLQELLEKADAERKHQLKWKLFVGAFHMPIIASVGP